MLSALNVSVPAFTVTAPKVLSRLLTVSAPLPTLVRLPLPVIPPVTVRIAAGSVISIVTPASPRVRLRFVELVRPVYCSVTAFVASPRAIPPPTPKLLFAPLFASDATLTVPALITTGPAKLFVVVIVSFPVPLLVSPVSPAMLPGPEKV